MCVLGIQILVPTFVGQVLYGVKPTPQSFFIIPILQVNPYTVIPGHADRVVAWVRGQGRCGGRDTITCPKSLYSTVLLQTGMQRLFFSHAEQRVKIMGVMTYYAGSLPLHPEAYRG